MTIRAPPTMASGGHFEACLVRGLVRETELRSCPVHHLRAEEALRSEDQDQDEEAEGPDVLPRAATEGARDELHGHGLDEPRVRPPTTAPQTLPMPPRTAAVNAFRPARKPIRKLMLVTCRPCATPATAARVAPRAKATTMIRSTLMPIRRAVSGSWETACMPRPVLVRLTKNHRPAAHMSRQPMVNRAERWIVTPPTSKAGPVTTSICGNGDALLGVREVEERDLAVEEPHGLLQEDRDADRGDERGEPRRVAQRAVGEALHEHRRGDRGDDRADDHERQHPQVRCCPGRRSARSRGHRTRRS